MHWARNSFSPSLPKFMVVSVIVDKEALIQLNPTQAEQCGILFLRAAPVPVANITSPSEGHAPPPTVR